MQTENTTSSINESLYSRQLLVLGPKAHMKMMQSKVLIVGMTGLGQEIAKNIVLAGVRTDIYDNSLVSMKDLNTGFYFQSKDVGKRKDACVLESLKELNTYVSVGICNFPDYKNIDEDIAMKYSIIVLVDADLSEQERMNMITRNSKIGFIGCMQKGLLGLVFNDFIKFTTYDLNGESAKIGSISDIVYEENTGEFTDGGITNDCDMEIQKNAFHRTYNIKTVGRHNLESGDHVKIGSEIFRITVTNPFEFSIVTQKEVVGDMYEEIKKIKTFKFKSMSEMMQNAEDVVFKLFHTHALFRKKYGRDPLVRDEEESNMFAEMYNAHYGLEDAGLSKIFAKTCTTAFMPVTSVIGGYVAQEALKYCSERFTPLVQFYYFNSYDLLLPSLGADSGKSDKKNENTETCEADDEYEPEVDSRFCDLIILFGKKNVKKILDAKIFLVGAGAIGCEHLKNLISHITVTDMDTIEESNLNRQFLFRKKNISDFKSVVAAKEICRMREETDQNKIIPYTLAVNSNSENVFSDSFLEKFDVFALALDNAEARQYMDDRAVILKVPLFDSGTLGTKGNSQCVIPYLTESYSSSRDPPEKEIPLCTVRNFPHLIEHCVEWALTQFQTLFSEIKQDDASDKNEDEKLVRTDEIKLGDNVLEEIDKHPPRNKKDCIKYAIELFVCFFKTNIQKLKDLFPEDHITEEGLKFWEPPKRVSTELELSEKHHLHLLFLLSCSNLLSACYLDGRKIGKDDFDENLNDEPCEVVEKKKIVFEKDDDSNYHVDFIYAAANLRAQNYKIKNAERLDVKRIAGKIIPAIATTTAVVSGLSCIEMYRYLLYKESLISTDHSPKGNETLNFVQMRPKTDIVFKNFFINLALPFVAFSETLPPIEYECLVFNKKFNLWDRIEIHDCTIEQIIGLFASHNYKVEMIGCGNKMLYCSFYNIEKNKKYYHKKILDNVPAECKLAVLNVVFDIECDNCMDIVVVR